MDELTDMRQDQKDNYVPRIVCQRLEQGIKESEVCWACLRVEEVNICIKLFLNNIWLCQSILLQEKPFYRGSAIEWYTT